MSETQELPVEEINREKKDESSSSSTSSNEKNTESSKDEKKESMNLDAKVEKVEEVQQEKQNDQNEKKEELHIPKVDLGSVERPSGFVSEVGMSPRGSCHVPVVWYKEKQEGDEPEPKHESRCLTLKILCHIKL